MDTAVTIVRAYLQSNGYFTMTEVPVLEATTDRGVRTATDLDVLAVRFPGERRLLAHADEDDGNHDRVTGAIDPVLDDHPEYTDFIIGEVKEGRAELNAAAVDPHVLRYALSRFGAFPPDRIPDMVEELRHRGETREGDKRVRLFAFGSYIDEKRRGRVECTMITHRQILDYFARFFKDLREEIPHMQTKDPFVGILMVMLKSGRFRY